jgi:hypothetical protein
MFSSTILDVAIGLGFVFLVISLIASAVTEAFASLVKLRSRTLLTGVKTLLNDPNGTGLVKDLYSHALINPRGTISATSAAATKNLPAYIDPHQFADALIELSGLAGRAGDAMKPAIAANQLLDNQTRTLLSGMVDRTAGDLNQIRTQLASWFDNAMDRVSGVYKRQTQLIGFIVAVLVTGCLNVDAIKVSTALWNRPLLVKAIDGKTYDNPRAALSDLDALGLPIGWNLEGPSVVSVTAPGGQTTSAAATPSSQRASFGWPTILGWFITAIASLLGAPFWYDALQTFVRIKGAGPSPAEKKTGAAAAA